MSKTIIKDGIEHRFIKTRKLARQQLKNAQGNNKIRRVWQDRQQQLGQAFWLNEKS